MIVNKFLLNNYTFKYFRKDLKAGLSVAAISLPQVMAYSMIAGLNPIYGIYTFIVSTIISTFTGVSSYMIVGPTNIVAVTIAGALNSLSITEPTNYLQGVLLITFIAGFIQILIGVFKLGYLVNFVSNSVISGLTYGVALIILTGQTIKFLGLKVETGNNVIMTFYNILTHIGQTNWYSFLLGVSSIIVIILSKKFFPKLPSYLVAVVIAILSVYLFDLTGKLEIVGSMQSSIPRFSFFEFDLDLMLKILSSAFSLAIISCVQILSIVKIMEKKAGEKAQINKEFIGQGITNIVCSFFNSFAITGSFTKSFANYEAGAKTRNSQLISGVTVLFLIVLLAPVVRYIPIPTLAGIVIYVALKMFNIKEIKKNVLTTKFDAILFAMTFVTTILTPRLDYAVYFGAMISAILVLNNTSTLEYSHISYNKNNDQFESYQNIENMESEDYTIINLTGTMHFNSANYLKEKLIKSYEKDQNFIIRMRRINNIDLTVIEELDKFIDKVQKENGRVILCGMYDQLYDSLKAYGIIDKINEEDVKFYNEKLFHSTKKAIKEVTDTR
ncbi:SulP family inorganic anion transporter [Halanaerobium sp. Z-7514]|uniref:SulP family inorganic anion transporter n=1 Tax=Halanaerobium polyolivorans TaxID=2886943 RepID=A0AAW4X1T0_9FIRM|nr:SulP family inorganic anion transporter [Halanaerobium polyolivorans]MCC3145774.1 SulP family inorganic anion transporter [Halanaerobium polyolivorans]